MALTNRMGPLAALRKAEEENNIPPIGAYLGTAGMPQAERIRVGRDNLGRPIYNRPVTQPWRAERNTPLSAPMLPPQQNITGTKLAGADRVASAPGGVKPPSALDKLSGGMSFTSSAGITRTLADSTDPGLGLILQGIDPAKHKALRMQASKDARAGEIAAMNPQQRAQYDSDQRLDGAMSRMEGKVLSIGDSRGRANKLGWFGPRVAANEAQGRSALGKMGIEREKMDFEREKFDADTANKTALLDMARKRAPLEEEGLRLDNLSKPGTKEEVSTLKQQELKANNIARVIPILEKQYAEMIGESPEKQALGQRLAILYSGEWPEMEFVPGVDEKDGGWFGKNEEAQPHRFNVRNPRGGLGLL